MKHKRPSLFPDDQRSRFVAGQTNVGSFMVRKLPVGECWSTVKTETFHDRGTHVATCTLGTWFVLAVDPAQQNQRSTPLSHWITSPISKSDKEHLDEIVKHQCVSGHVRCGRLDAT